MHSTSSPWRRPLQRFYWHSVLALTLLFVLGTLLLVLLVRGALSALDVRLALEVGGPVGLLVAGLEVYVYPQLFARVRLLARLGLGMLFYLASAAGAAWPSGPRARPSCACSPATAF